MMKSNYEIAQEVLDGKWGNGAERKKRITEAGYNYSDIQGIVNALLSDTLIDPVEEKQVFKITGTEIMEIEVNLSKYKGIKLNFTLE